MADRVLRRIENAMVTCSVGALLLMMIIMVVEVVLRYLLSAPLSWSVGFVSNYLLVGFFFLGLPHTVREGAHISIDMLHRRFPPGWQAVCTRGGFLLGAVFFAALAYGGAALTTDAIVGGDVPPPGSAELSWPVWTSTVMVPLGCAVTVLRLLQMLVAHSAGAPAAPSTPDAAAEVR